MKAGFVPGIIFLLLVGALTFIMNLAYGEVVLRTNGSHQLTGYAGMYLGAKWKKAILFTFILAIYSALLAYIIVSGQFLATALSDLFAVTPTAWSVWFFIILAGLSFGSIKRIAKFEFFITAAILTMVAVFISAGIPKVNISNIPIFQNEFMFLPYGILLFALFGLSAVPLQREILNGNEGNLKKAIYIGTAIPAILSLIFAIVVVGVSGDATSPEAISGAMPILGEWAGILGSLLGALAVSTAFVAHSRIMIEIFQFDFHLKKLTSWSLTVIPPFLLFMSGTRDFIRVINLAGGVAIGLELIVFIALYHNARRKGTRIPEYSLRLPAWSWYAMMALFGIGIFYTLYF